MTHKSLEKLIAMLKKHGVTKFYWETPKEKESVSIELGREYTTIPEEELKKAEKKEIPEDTMYWSS